MQARTAFNVVERGRTHGPVMMFAHGYGCDQNMWRSVAPSFEDRYRVVLLDFVGAGGAQAPYDAVRYATLDGYADDVIRVCHELELTDIVFVGHSVAAMIGVLAEIAEPDRFEALVMVGPSPRYLDDADGYVGGFKAPDIEGLLDALSSNYLGWSSTMAPAIMGNPDRPELADELEASFCTVDPMIAAGFARATFLADNREDLAKVRARTLVLQCQQDIIAPLEVGRYVAEKISGATLVVLEAQGHCPHLSAPGEVVAAIDDFVAQGS